MSRVKKLLWTARAAIPERVEEMKPSAATDHRPVGLHATAETVSHSRAVLSQEISHRVEDHETGSQLTTT